MRNQKVLLIGYHDLHCYKLIREEIAPSASYRIMTIDFFSSTILRKSMEIYRNGQKLG